MVNMCIACGVESDHDDKIKIIFKYKIRTQYTPECLV